MDFPKNTPPMLKHLCMLLAVAGPEATIDFMKQFPEPVMKSEGPLKVGTIVRVPMTDELIAHVTIEGWLEPSRFTPDVPRFRGTVKERENESCVFSYDEIVMLWDETESSKFLEGKLLTLFLLKRAFNKKINCNPSIIPSRSHP